MLVDTPRNLEKIRININVTVPRIPCYVIALDTEDILVSDTPYTHHRTHSCSPNGGSVVVVVKGGGVEDFQEKSIVKLHMESPDSELSGCSIAGYINVPKVPGNFHLSTHGRNVKAQDIDMQHNINSFFFTDSPRGEPSNHV